MTNQLYCENCESPAVVSMLADPFGKSDAVRNFCAVHTPDQLRSDGGWPERRAQNDTPNAVQRVVMSWFPPQ